LHPDYRDVFGALHELCTKTIGHVETQLANQKASDEADAKKMEEDRKRIDAMARLEAERERQEKADALRRMKEEEDIIKAAERKLQLKKQALRDAQRAANPPVVDEDDVSVSTVGEQVSHL
jgi:membrane protein involved in colicin uptake